MVFDRSLLLVSGVSLRGRGGVVKISVGAAVVNADFQCGSKVSLAMHDLIIIGWLGETEAGSPELGQLSLDLPIRS
jgi:hypothetical protein